MAKRNEARTHVYFNLHRACWSLMLRGKVTGHASALHVDQPTFVVREGGRQRVLREGRKNVHAFVVGDVSMATGVDYDRSHGWTRITYRPQLGSFVDAVTLAPVRGADECVMLADRSVWASNPY
jgi:hypothetical protein